MPGVHPLAGRLVPDLTLDDGRRVAELLHGGRPILLDLCGGVVVDATHDWRHRVDAVVATIGSDPVRAMLIRPDGYIAWAADVFEQDDEQRLYTSLRRWFGPPR